jgi:tRNA (cmo5U34)-methyltransferase
MNNVKSSFEKLAFEFDLVMPQVIPFYKDMVESLVQAAALDRTGPVRVIDLGCGTGVVSKRIKEVFPEAQITCLDMAENMLEMARAKLSSYSGLRFVLSDFSSYSFDGRYDIVVSSLAIHHLDDPGKKILYAKIHDALAEGGIFLNADLVLGASESLQRLYMRQWEAFMLEHRPADEVRTKWIAGYAGDDRPAKLADQFQWLNEIGFRAVDVVWKYYLFAVYGGRKQAGSAAITSEDSPRP